MELSTQYDPKEAEKDHYERWEKSGCFAPEVNEDPTADTYSIVIPPPNVTGSLHMGHALQHTLMDVLTRRKRMQGFRTLFLVGVDHAGISTQLMVTRKLWEEEKKTPQDIGREAFVAKVWDWKTKYGGEITAQMRREGISVDWSRERFTMDESLSKAVRNVFVKLYEDGQIYRGARIVNWCPKDKTVLSDLEVEDKEKKDGKLYYLKYPVNEAETRPLGSVHDSKAETRPLGSVPNSASDNIESAETRPLGSVPNSASDGMLSAETLTVATTRPETMLGDTAVAVNPNDERYKHLIGKTIKLPLTNREIPIIADEYVESEFGTGAVKITPAHDPNDYEMGLRHDLPQLTVMNLDATMNEAAGAEFNGLDRLKAREKVVEKFEELGLLEKIDDHEMVLPVCERCKTVVETLISEQWWVRMEEMRDLALNLMKETGFPHFTPKNPHAKVYTDWLENLRDWTISRQLWWGHQIPAWYDEAGKVYVARTKEEAAAQAGTDKLTQEEDVLDTWFSSWLWSFSTLGWNGETTETEDLTKFHPTSVLVSGRDIIYLWISRMVMSSMKFLDERPFDDVYITGTVLDKNGQRMSKTKGNGIDPLDVFDKYGVDATRMTLAGSSTGADFAWRDERVESFRNFANKIWNATRFCLMNSEGASVDHSNLMDRESFTIADKWIVSKLNRTAIEVNRALDNYSFHEAVQLLYHFFWDDFCDWYIELVKDEITDSDGRNATARERADTPPSSLRAGIARTRIITILEIALRMLHPFMPYLTEELWQKLPGTDSGLHHDAYKNAGATIMLASFPPGDKAAIDEKAENEMQLVIELITKIRNIRAEMRIKSSEFFDVHIAAGDRASAIFRANEAQILKLARAKSLNISGELNVPKASAKAVLTDGTGIAVPLEGLIDFEMERTRLSAQINNLNNEGDKLKKQLANENFVTKAPAEKVEALRERVAEIDTQLNALNENLAALN
ncbi:MAG: valine--tRNA ligase [Pyrinomonadaceae bacterium]|nr:valine--tRNA ligase [Pyrinomonadaceae bacterium]